MSAKPVAILGALTLVACGGGGGIVGDSSPTGNAELVALHHGRLVDVYGLRNISGGLTFSLFQTDVLVGPDIQDAATIPARSESPMPTHTAGVPRLASTVSGIPTFATSGWLTWTHVQSSATAPPPPTTANSALSVRSWRTSRQRLAPTASRMAISR